MCFNWLEEEKVPHFCERAMVLYEELHGREM
jgi:hypothetical protein